MPQVQSCNSYPRKPSRQKSQCLREIRASLQIPASFVVFIFFSSFYIAEQYGVLCLFQPSLMSSNQIRKQPFVYTFGYNLGIYFSAEWLIAHSLSVVFFKKIEISWSGLPKYLVPRFIFMIFWFWSIWALLFLLVFQWNCHCSFFYFTRHLILTHLKSPFNSSEFTVK